MKVFWVISSKIFMIFMDCSIFPAFFKRNKISSNLGEISIYEGIVGHICFDCKGKIG